jgi:CRP/FNR family transcriptional regulator, cyclic AMP receptor protein
METIEPLIAKHPLFNQLDSVYLKLIAGCAKNVVIKLDQYIFREGEAADFFYVIRDGRVNIESYSPKTGSVTIQSCSDGEVIGWSSLFAPFRWHFDARAMVQTRLVALDAKCLRTKFEKDHNLGYEMMIILTKVLADRLDATRMQLLDVYEN